MDYGICTLTSIHKKVKRFNIEIPGIIFGGLCYTLPIDVPDLPIDHPRANLLNFSYLMYETDKQFQNKCDELFLKSVHEVQQQQQQQQQHKHIDLMDILTILGLETLKRFYGC